MGNLKNEGPEWSTYSDVDIAILATYADQAQREIDVFEFPAAEIAERLTKAREAYLAAPHPRAKPGWEKDHRWFLGIDEVPPLNNGMHVGSGIGKKYQPTKYPVD
jgi:hypothetical protein